LAQAVLPGGVFAMVDWWPEPAVLPQAIQAPPQRLHAGDHRRRRGRSSLRLAALALVVGAIECLAWSVWLQPESDSCAQHPALVALPRFLAPGDAQETLEDSSAADQDAGFKSEGATAQKDGALDAPEESADAQDDDDSSEEGTKFPEVDPDKIYHYSLEAVVRSGWVTQTVHIVPILPQLVEYWDQAPPKDLYPIMRYCPGRTPHLHVLIRTREHLSIWSNETSYGRLKRSDYHGHHVIVYLNGESRQYAQLGFPRLVPISPGLRRRIRFPFIGKKPQIAMELDIIAVPADSYLRFVAYIFYPVLLLFVNHDILYVFTPLAMKLTILFFSVMFMMIIIWPKIRGRWAKFLSRRCRLRQLRSMRSSARRERPVYHQEDCCICLDELSEDGSLFMLLPCKHVVHEPCYSRWICSYCYVNRQLRCPLCSVQVAGLGIPTAAKAP